MKEIYQRPPTLTNVRISNLGNVQRWSRVHGWRTQKQSVGTGGQRYVNVAKEDYSKQTTICVAKEVAKLFLPPPPEFDETINILKIIHKDGDRANNCFTNLMWKIALRSDKKAQRTNHLYNPFTKKQGEALLTLRARGWAMSDLMARFPQFNANQLTNLFKNRLAEWKKGRND